MSWPVVELGSVVSFIGGSQPPKSTFKYELEDGYVRLLQIRDYKSDDNLTYIPENSTKKFCSKDDVMIGRYGPPVFQMLRGLEGAYNVALMKAQPSEKVDRDYLFYFLKQEKLFRLIDGLSQRTAGQSGVDMDALKAYPMLLPPLEEQKRIAAILDKADAIRRKRQQAINLADEFLRSVFLDMFGDPVTNPKGWDVKKVKNFAKVTTGNTPSRKEAKYYGEDIEWIKSDNINTPGHILTTASEFLSYEGEKVARTVEKGSTLITCIAGSFDCIGNVAFADRKVSFNQQINALIPKHELVSDWFLYSLILFSKKLIQNASTNSMKGMVSKGKLEAVELILPPLEKQKEFEMIFNKQIKLKQKMNQSYLGSNTKFNSLSQKAFAGEL